MIKKDDIKKDNGFVLVGEFKFIRAQHDKAQGATLIIPLVSGEPVSRAKIKSLDADDNSDGAGSYRLMGFYDTYLICDVSILFSFVKTDKLQEPVLAWQSSKKDLFEMLSPHQGKYISFRFYPHAGNKQPMKQYELMDKTMKVKEFVVSVLKGAEQIGVALEFDDGSPPIHIGLSPRTAALMAKTLADAVKHRDMPPSKAASGDLAAKALSKKKKLH